MPKFRMYPETPPKPRPKTLADWNTFLERITYRPGWSITCIDRGDGSLYLFLSANVINAYHHAETTMLNSAYPLRTELLTEKEMLQEVYEALKVVELHELGEFLVLDGTRPFDPHRMNP